MRKPAEPTDVEIRERALARIDGQVRRELADEKLTRAQRENREREATEAAIVEVDRQGRAALAALRPLYAARAKAATKAAASIAVLVEAEQAVRAPLKAIQDQWFAARRRLSQGRGVDPDDLRRLRVGAFLPEWHLQHGATLPGGFAGDVAHVLVELVCGNYVTSSGIEGPAGHAWSCLARRPR